MHSTRRTIFLSHPLQGRDRVNRKQWKWVYRLVRLNRREASNAFDDMMVYGSGFVRIHSDGTSHHVPTLSVYRPPAKPPAQPG